MLWGLPNLVGSKAPGPIRRVMARSRPLLEDPQLMKLALLGQTNHVFGLPQPVELSDDELRSITVPTTAVIAGRSAPFEPKRAALRASLVPGAVVDVVDRAGHEVMWTQVDRCTAHVLGRGKGDRGTGRRGSRASTSAESPIRKGRSCRTSYRSDATNGRPAGVWQCVSLFRWSVDEQLFVDQLGDGWPSMNR